MGQEHCGQRGMQVLGDLAIVVAHHRDIVRNPQAQLMQRLIASDRHQVISAENRGRRALEVHEFARGFVAGQRLPVALAHEVRVEGQVGGRERLAIAAEAMARGFHARFAVDVADAAMAGADEEVGRRVAAGRLARHDRGQGGVRHVAIQEHGRQRRRRRRRLDETRVDGRIDEADKRLRGQLRERRAFHVGVAPRRHDHDREAELPRLFAHAVEADRGPRVGRNLVADEADRGRSRHAGRAAAPNRLVAEPGRGLHHPLARLGGKPRAIGMVEDKRHGGLRDARLVGDVDHRRPARRSFSTRIAGSPGRSPPFRGGRPAVSLLHRFPHPFANIISSLKPCFANKNRRAAAQALTSFSRILSFPAGWFQMGAPLAFALKSPQLTGQCAVT